MFAAVTFTLPLSEWLAGVVLVAAAITALGVIWKKALGPFVARPLGNVISERIDLATVKANEPVLMLLQRHEARLERVEKEVTTNGGSSLKDLVIRFMAESSGDRGRLHTEVAVLRGEVGRLEDLITDHQLDDHNTVPGEKP